MSVAEYSASAKLDPFQHSMFKWRTDIKLYASTSTRSRLFVSPRMMAKRALLVGIRYNTFPEKFTLTSSYNDVVHVRNFLIGSLGFAETDIREMRDDFPPSDPRYPTKANMEYALEELVQGARPGDHMIFHFSGHGSQQTDWDGDELDGKDEAIWPVDALLKSDEIDVLPETIILDDDIKRILVDKVGSGASLVILLDCCHSGTGADLANVYTDPHWDSPIPAGKVAMRKLTNKGVSSGKPVVVSWAACQDPHVALSSRDSGGFFIKAFIESFNHNPKATHQQLLHSIKLKMFAEAEEHLEKQKPHLLARGHWGKVQRWLRNLRTEPVLGILYDKDAILDTPVATVLGAAWFVTEERAYAHGLTDYIPSHDSKGEGWPVTGSTAERGAYDLAPSVYGGVAPDYAQPPAFGGGAPCFPQPSTFEGPSIMPQAPPFVDGAPGLSQGPYFRGGMPNFSQEPVYQGPMQAPQCQVAFPIAMPTPAQGPTFRDDTVGHTQAPPSEGIWQGTVYGAADNTRGDYGQGSGWY